MMTDPDPIELERRRRLEALQRMIGMPADATRVSRPGPPQGPPVPTISGLPSGTPMPVEPEEPGILDRALSLGRTALDFTPIGDVLAAGNAGRDVARGNFGSAAVNLLASAPVIGVVGDALKKKKKATAALEALLPGQSITRATRSGGAIPNFREMSPEAALEAARRGEHLRRVGQADQYVGAPRGVESPKQLRELRENYDQLVERGVEGGDWYDRAQASVVEAAGYNPERQRLFAQEAGLWSAQANPDTNLGFLLQGHNAYERGLPLDRVRTGQQARTYRTARDAGTDIRLGPKTGEYVNKFDPTSKTSHISTNDIWHFRNWDYKTPDGKPWSAGGTPQMHSFVDAESMLAADRANARALGGRADWDAASTQAAPWVYAKGADLHKKFPKRFPTLQDGIDEAAKTYNDSFPKYAAAGTYEAIPGAGTGHLEGIVGAPAELRAAYSSDPRSSWTLLSEQERAWRDLLPEHLRVADNRDVLYDAAGMYPVRSKNATGFFRPSPGAPLETNPAFVARPLVDLTNSPAGSVMTEGSQRTMDAVEALRSYLDAQNAGAWHKTLPAGRTREATSMRVPMNRQLSEGEVRSLADLVEPRGFGVVDTGDGVTLLNFGEGPSSGADLAKLIKGSKETPGLGSQIEDVLPDATGPLDRVRVNSGYVMQDEGFNPLLRAENAGTGRATAALERYLTDPAVPALLDKLDADPRLRQAALDRFTRDADYAQQLGTATREDIQRARQIIAERGLKGLFEAARQGAVLPVLAIGILGGAAATAPQNEGPTG
jgi:hypothetical protein